MNRARYLVSLLSLAAVAFLGCTDSGPTSLRPWGAVMASAKDGRIRITNRTMKPVYTSTFGRELAVHILLVQCVDPIKCPPIAPGDTEEVSYPSLGIPEGEREAVVYWWHAPHTGPSGEQVPDSLRSTVVKL